MADVHWADRYAVDRLFIREMLLRERNEVTDECMRDRRFGVTVVRSGVTATICRSADLANPSGLLHFARVSLSEQVASPRDELLDGLRASAGDFLDSVGYPVIPILAM
jgi:hypothetical protein